MFDVRISSSTSCSDWPPETLAATLAAPAHTGGLKVATLAWRPKGCRFESYLRSQIDEKLSGL
jgi:hypothetical protein